MGWENNLTIVIELSLNSDLGQSRTCICIESTGDLRITYCSVIIISRQVNIIVEFARDVGIMSEARIKRAHAGALSRSHRYGRPRDPVDGGVDTRTRRQGCGLREKVLREKGGSPVDKRRADLPRGAGRSRYARGHDNRPGPTVRASQPDSRQGWDTKVALWISPRLCARALIRSLYRSHPVECSAHGYQKFAC